MKKDEQMYFDKKGTIVILVLLAISFCINIFFITYTCYKNSSASDKPIVGTYCTSNGPSGNGIYFCFERDGNYVIYKQFNVIENGTYKKENNNIYLLKKSGNDKSQYIIYNDNDSIHYVDSSNNVTYFSRIGDIPTYINVQKSDTK